MKEEERLREEADKARLAELERQRKAAEERNQALLREVRPLLCSRLNGTDCF